jgi:hypothetical protein
MSAQGFFSNWAKERIDEMDAALTSLESRVGEINSDLQSKANQTLTDLRKKRDEFGDFVKKQAEASEAAWTSAKPQLEADWARFETELLKYVNSFGEQIQQQQATFKLQANAQLKAWREATEKFQVAAAGFAAERRSEIEANVKRMKADADAAEEKLKKLSQAGTQSWSILTAALAETRAVFDRANQEALEAFKRAA